MSRCMWEVWGGHLSECDIVTPTQTIGGVVVVQGTGVPSK